MPDRLVRGRLVLVGDAAHVPSPMTGRGFGTSLDDAAALGRRLRDVDGNSVPGALVPHQATFALSTTVRRRLSSAWWFRQMM
ncbi:FAD-dependent monooxygenase [Streptomyces sp. LBL]|uniref:FAD-dependent oxidoreductase n=1 Tax=Streptomyces sp. LBL TaxID=2940562 RepID=UPI0024741F5F|nr:FAD-dependent monooxygenase [Streptomyces sp. LBL]